MNIKRIIHADIVFCQRYFCSQIFGRAAPVHALPVQLLSCSDAVYLGPADPELSRTPDPHLQRAMSYKHYPIQISKWPGPVKHDLNLQPEYLQSIVQCKNISPLKCNQICLDYIQLFYFYLLMQCFGLVFEATVLLKAEGSSEVF